MTNGAYFLAQFGNRRERKLSRSMLLEIADLPEGIWKVVGDRLWRTGARGEQGEVVLRARQAGSFTAWRSFKLETPRGGFWTEVILCASSEDAELLVPGNRTTAIKNPKFKGTAGELRVIEDQQIPGVAIARITEQLTVTDDGGPGSTRKVAGSIGRAFFVIYFTRRPGEWQWSEVTSIAASQAIKIRKNLGDSE
jgi:hypothetical protein